jgi:hypothetical protein
MHKHITVKCRDKKPDKEYCIVISLVNTKISFTHLPQSTLFIICGSGYDLEIQPRLSISITLTVYFLPPPPHNPLADMRGNKYWAQPKCSSVLSVAVTRIVTAQWLSTHHQHRLQDLTSVQYPLRKNNLALFVGLLLCPFLVRRSLGCLKSSSDFHLSFGYRLQGPASLPDYHENHLT